MKSTDRTENYGEGSMAIHKDDDDDNDDDDDDDEDDKPADVLHLVVECKKFQS